MFEPNGSHRPPGLDGRSADNPLLTKGKSYHTILLGYAGVILFAGLSGLSWAVPQSAQSGNVETGISRDFSATAAVTLPETIAVGWSEMGNARSAPLGYDVDFTVASGAGSVLTKLRDNAPSNSTVIAGRENMSRLSDAEAVAVRAPGVVLAAAAHPGASESASLGSAPTGSKGKPREAGEPLSGEAPKYPYGTVTLAVLALLGLVSVARRGDKI